MSTPRTPRQRLRMKSSARRRKLSVLESENASARDKPRAPRLDLQNAEQRRIDAEAAFVEQQAEHVQDDKTTVSERTATMMGSEGGDDATPQGGTPVGGLKRARDQNPSVTQFAAVEPPAPAATEDAAPAPKKLKLSFKIKKPTT